MALEDVLVAATVRPVYIGFLDIKDAPMRGWTGPGILVPTGTGDPDLDSETFEENVGAIDITDFSEDQGIGGPLTLTFAVTESEGGWIWGEAQWDVDIFGQPGGEPYNQLVADRRVFMGRTAKFWLAFLSEDESSILSYVEPMFSGVMVAMETKRQPGSPQLISITCDQDTQKAGGPPSRWIDHQSFYSSDTASSYINDLSRGSITAATPYSPSPAPSVRPTERQRQWR